jgi:glycosyltransferase involved in cell wall biosynthesis
MKTNEVISIVSVSDINQINGVSTFVKNLYKNISERGSDVRLICNNKNEHFILNDNSKTPSLEIKVNPAIKSFSYFKKLIRLFVFSNAITQLFYAVYIYIVKSYFFARFARKNISKGVVHFNDLFTLAFFNNTTKSHVVLTLHCSNNPLEQVFHNFPKIESSFAFVFNFFLKKNILNAHHIVTLGNEAKDYCASITDAPITVIYNGVPKFCGSTESGNDNKNVIRLVNVGSVCHRKGQDLLVSAMNKMLENDCENIVTRLEIDVIGIGNKLSEFVSTSSNPYLKFIGARSNVVSLLSEYDAFILPSRDEGLPIAVLEAMSVGLPIFSTDVGSIHEALGESVIYFEPEMSSVFELLNSVQSNKFNFEELSLKSTDCFLKSFTIDEMVNSYFNVYYKYHE